MAAKNKRDLSMAQKNVLSPKVVKKVKLFATLLEKEGISLKKLILFGSQVSGKAKSYSDIDICVVSPGFDKDYIKKAVKLKMLAEKVDWRIEPHLYHPDDFAIEEDPFAWEIKRTGIEIK